MTEGELKKRLVQYFKEHVANISVTKGFADGYVYDIEQLVDEAKKDINNTITKHLEDLIDFWKNDKTVLKHLEKYRLQYVDAYTCILNNHKKRDVFKIKKWFGDSS